MVMTPAQQARQNTRSQNGEYAPYQRDMPSLEALDSLRREERTRAIVTGGDVDASSTARDEQAADRWWEAGLMTAEYKADDTDYPKMPEYDAGDHRTYRHRYHFAGGLTLTMPAKAAVLRFADTNGWRTFDMPVSATNERGEHDTTWMRVTPDGTGGWSVIPLAGDHRHGRVAEAVASTLEARRPTLDVQEIADLAEKRHQRIMAEGAPLREPLKPSFITNTGMSPDGSVTYVDINGRKYAYNTSAYDLESREALRAKLEGRDDNTHIGSAYNRWVKSQPRIAVGQCPICHNVYDARQSHRCRIVTTRPQTDSRSEQVSRSEAMTGIVRRFPSLGKLVHSLARR